MSPHLFSWFLPSEMLALYISDDIQSGQLYIKHINIFRKHVIESPRKFGLICRQKAAFLNMIAGLVPAVFVVTELS